MADDPWTKDDPESGDFDKGLEAIDRRFFEHYAGDPNARLRLLRRTGKRVVDEHADALRLLADHDAEDDV